MFEQKIFPPVSERFLHQVRVEWPQLNETAGAARIRLADKFPRTALRRMTHLGLLMGSVLDGIPLEKNDALVYATTFAETRALEDFLTSFPAASPMLFQTSIHPGGVQQVLIGRQQCVARLWPLAGRARLVEHALLTALMEPAARVILLGGEERGSWMLEHGMAAQQPFAFSAVLDREAAGSIGRLTFAAGDTSDEPCPPLEDFAQALAAREAIAWDSPNGRWALQWS